MIGLLYTAHPNGSRHNFQNPLVFVSYSEPQLCIAVVLILMLDLQHLDKSK